MKSLSLLCRLPVTCHLIADARAQAPRPMTHTSRSSRLALLVVSAVFLALGFTASPLAAATSGNFTYTDDGTSITIIGYPTTATGAVNIPATIAGKPVTAIAAGVFYDCTTITSVTIPEGVIYLGDAAFEYCYDLASVKLPSTVTGIGAHLFLGCSSLTSLTIPANVILISNYAFFGCTSLHDVTIPASVANIQEGAFSGCSSLKSATFLGNAPAMEGFVFTDTQAGFIVYYTAGKAGFTSPTWMGYNSAAVKSTSIALAPISGPTNNGAILHFTATAATGLSVRLQSSVDNQVWLNLPDNNDAKMAESATMPGKYDLDSTFYPTGASIYFRAVASTPKGDVRSSPQGPFTLTRADLSIQMKAASNTDPASGSVTISGDDLTYTFTAINQGSATARKLILGIKLPTYVDEATHDKKQFKLSDIPLDSSSHPMISSGGKFKAATGATTFDGQIIWNAGDLAPGEQLSESFTLHITNKVLAPQDIRVPNDYVVYSSSFQPPYSATGYSSGSPNVSTHVRGPITFTAVARTASVAPGGLITYKFRLANLTHSAVAHAVAVVTVPEFTRFATTYPTASGGSVFGVEGVNNLGSGFGGDEVFAVGQSASQVLIDAGPLAAAGDAKDFVVFNVTFQAQWVDPAEAPKIGAFEYYATFFNKDLFNNPDNPAQQITQYDLFMAKLLKALGTTASAPGPTDFISFIKQTDHEIALSHQDSGDVNVPLLGSFGNRPKLALSKTISNTGTDTVSRGDDLFASVEPGDRLTFVLLAVNLGKSVANDVYIQDGLPDHTTLLKVTANLRGSTASTQASNLRVKLDSDGHHVRFEGLTLLPRDGVVLEYSVQVNSGPNAPAVGTSILPAAVINPDTGLPEGGVGASTISSSSMPHTTVGYYSDGAIKVTGAVSFAEPKAHLLVPAPGVSTDLITTADALTAIYNQHWNALPLSNPADPTSFIPGVERYYIHYENVGNVAVHGVKLDFPLPANTAFYRASFAALAPGDDIGSLIDAPNGAGIIPPAGADSGFLATSGRTTFTFGSLAPGDKGDVMVEVIVKSNAVTVKSPLVGFDDASIVIHDAPVPPATVAAHKNQSPMPVLKVDTSNQALSVPAPRMAAEAATSPNPADVPKLAISRTVPKEVKPGDPFQVQITILNVGDTVARNPFLFWTQPAGTKIVKFEYGDGKKQNPKDGDPIHTYTFEMASNNGTVDYSQGAGSWSINPTKAACVTITLQATGSVGSDINFQDDAHVSVDYMGQVFAASEVTHLTATPQPGLSFQVTGAVLSQHNVNGADVIVTKLNDAGTYIVAQGGGNVVSQGGGNVLSQGGGNMDAKGGGSVMVSGLASNIMIGNTTGDKLAAQNAGVVAQGGGNVVGSEGTTILARLQDGTTFAASGGGIVAQGGGNIVAQGGGNIVSQGGGNFISHNGSAIVAQGGGNVVSQGGGNIVAQGGGNIAPPGAISSIPQNGASNVVSVKPQILSSLPGSSVTITTAFGNRIGANGSNFRPSH